MIHFTHIQKEYEAISKEKPRAPKMVSEAHLRGPNERCRDRRSGPMMEVVPGGHWEEKMVVKAGCGGQRGMRSLHGTD